MNCNQEQFERLISALKKGSMNDWNLWKKLDYKQKINLSNTYLAKAKLENIDLSNANLEGCDFSDSDLSNANLKGANLKGAILRNANIDQANLTGADMRGAKFERANLFSAISNNAAFDEANLSFTNLDLIQSSNSSFKSALLYGTSLNRAQFEKSSFKGAILNGANINGTSLQSCDLEGADLQDANISNCNLSYSKIEKANLTGAIINGSNFLAASVDGNTLIWNVSYNDKTDFSGVGLDSARIEPRLKEGLKWVIRKRQWEKWYEECPPGIAFIRKLFIKRLWEMSNYGASTIRIIFWFAGIAIGFAAIYWLFGVIEYENTHNSSPGVVSNLFLGVNTENLYEPVYLFRALYFSIVTMTTLGFGDMCAVFCLTTKYALVKSWLGQFLLIIQVLFGYILLGVLISRLAVLFTSDGPGETTKKRIRS